MSRFFSRRLQALTPYTPGEQPTRSGYIKLNTNESPFPPSPKAVEQACAAARRLQLYPDPTCRELTERLALRYGVSPDEVLLSNGSDEVLNFAFLAFCDTSRPAVFPDLTYGFYPVYAQLNGVPYTEIPLREDFTVGVEDYLEGGKTVFLANPNAPTGLALSPGEIQRILAADPDRLVVVDEAYVDFGGESCVPLIHRYDNLLVIQTFSKSRSMAGARLGFALGCPALIRDLNTVKYSINPYNINLMTMAAGLGALEDEEYTRRNCDAVIQTRAYTVSQLRQLGFVAADSAANFVFAMHPRANGGALYQALKARGILIRHFDKPRIAQYNRITIGTRAQMDALLAELRTILQEG